MRSLSQVEDDVYAEIFADVPVHVMRRVGLGIALVLALIALCACGFVDSALRPGDEVIAKASCVQHGGLKSYKPWSNTSFLVTCSSGTDIQLVRPSTPIP